MCYVLIYRVTVVNGSVISSLSLSTASAGCIYVGYGASLNLYNVNVSTCGGDDMDGTGCVVAQGHSTSVVMDHVMLSRCIGEYGAMMLCSGMLSL